MKVTSFDCHILKIPNGISTNENYFWSFEQRIFIWALEKQQQRLISISFEIRTNENQQIGSESVDYKCVGFIWDPTKEASFMN